MKTFIFFLLSVSILCMACKGKKETPDKPEISAISIIKGQINHLDTSLYLLKKFEKKDGKTDTSFIKREEIRTLAADFLSLPDITQKGFAEKYTDEHLIENGQNTLSIISTAKNDELELRKQIIIVPIDELATGKVQSIYFEQYIVKDSMSIEKKLFWQIDKYFQVGKIIQSRNLPEKISSTKVTWE
jgi:hypothetical protein